MSADSQAGDASSGDRCDCESRPADIPDPEESREVSFEDVLDGIDDIGDQDFGQSDALGDFGSQREVICPPPESGSCPPEWSPIDGSCLPGDCDYSEWMAGQCVTQLTTVHATGPFLFSPGDSAEDVCGPDHEPMFLNPDFGPGSIVCFDVPRIGAYLGPYFTHDGGATWTGVTKVSVDEQLLYFGIVEGDRFCPSEGSSCESWSYAFDTGVLNVQVPSFVWHRTDDACTYRPAIGNLPFVEAIPGLGPCNLAPFTVLALGNGRAVVFLGRKAPPII